MFADLDEDKKQKKTNKKQQRKGKKVEETEEEKKKRAELELLMIDEVRIDGDVECREMNPNTILI